MKFVFYNSGSIPVYEVIMSFLSTVCPYQIVF